jgi:hypothetical protein
MPLPTPPGALVAAYRVYCLQCVRYMIKYPDYTCEFDKATSKKCSYCTVQNALCYLVSVRNGSELIVILICNRFRGFAMRSMRLSLVVTLVRVSKKLPLLSRLLSKLLLWRLLRQFLRLLL